MLTVIQIDIENIELYHVSRYYNTKDLIADYSLNEYSINNIDIVNNTLQIWLNTHYEYLIVIGIREDDINCISHLSDENRIQYFLTIT